MNINNVIALAEFEKEQNGKLINFRTLLDQMGRMNWLAISGGRYEVYKTTVFLPVSKGFWVAVTLTAADDYKVSRIYLRSGKATVKAEVSGVYAEQIGEVAYRMSCYENAV